MKLTVGQSDTLEASTGGWGGLLVAINIVGANNDYSLLPADFLMDYLQINVYLLRGGKRYDIFQNNILNKNQGSSECQL